MRDTQLLHELLKNQCPNLHQKRLDSLMVAVRALLDGQQLSLTELGRNIKGTVINSIGQRNAKTMAGLSYFYPANSLGYPPLY